MQQFNLDISQPRGPLVFYVSQGDSLSRFFSVALTDNGVTYTPPDGAIYTVRFGAPGMPAGWYDTITEVGGGTHPAVVVDENTCTVEIAEQAVSKPGQNALVLIISDATGYTLASWAFALRVAAVPGYGAPEATVYYNALTEQVAQVLSGATAAAASATLAESWAVGGTGTRPGEDTNNAEYWASEAQRVSQGALGWYETEQALQAAHPTGENGQWAIIGSTDTIWTWDSDTSAWVDSGAQVDLSNYYTKAQADAAFATAAQGEKADTAVQTVNGQPGPSVGASTRPNLLHNAIFAAGALGLGPVPINQRGVSGTISSPGYFLDRWKLASGTVQITSSGLVLNGTIEQILETSARQTVTASALSTTGVIGAQYSDATKTFSLTATGKTIVAAKLEVGAGQTLALDTALLPQPGADYTTQLAICQRFYRRLVANGAYSPFYVGSSSVSAVFFRLFDIDMRATPALIASGSFVLRGNGGTTTASNLSFGIAGKAAPTLSVSASGLTASQVYQLLSNNDADAFIELSADL